MSSRTKLHDFVHPWSPTVPDEIRIMVPYVNNQRRPAVSWWILSTYSQFSSLDVASLGSKCCSGPPRGGIIVLAYRERELDPPPMTRAVTASHIEQSRFRTRALKYSFAHYAASASSITTSAVIARPHAASSASSSAEA